jgi:hypothetical protein
VIRDARAAVAGIILAVAALVAGCSSAPCHKNCDQQPVPVFIPMPPVIIPHPAPAPAPVEEDPVVVDPVVR